MLPGADLRPLPPRPRPPPPLPPPLPRHRDDWNVAVFGIGFGPHRHFTVLHYPARREDWGPCVCVDRAVGGGGGGGGGVERKRPPRPPPKVWARDVGARSTGGRVIQCRVPYSRRWVPVDRLRRVSETNTAWHVSCLSIKISSKTKKTKPNPKFPLPRPPRVPLARPGVASWRPRARWPKPARSGPVEAIRGGPGRGPASGPAAGRPRRFAIRIRPADVRSGCRAPPGGRFYIVPSLRSSGDRAKGRDLAAVPGEALRAAGVTGGIVPVEPWRRRVARSPEIGGAGF